MPYFREILKNFGDIQGKDCLEIGHGQDREIRGVLEEFGLIYHGTDVYNGESNKSHTKQKGEEYHGYPMEDLGFQDKSFDIVVVVHAFEHTEQPIASLREMKRVLKDGGRLLMVTPYPCKHQILDADEDHVNVLSDMQLLRLLRYVNFKLAGSNTQRDWLQKEQDWNVFTVAGM